MAQVLLYNITDREKLVKIKLSLFRLGVPCREIPAEDFAHPLGYLLGREGFFPAALPPEASFSDELLLMDQLPPALFNRFLDELRAVRATVALKAVATEHNLPWSSLRLHRELRQEHRAMSRMKKSVHRKKK